LFANNRKREMLEKTLFMGRERRKGIRGGKEEGEGLRPFPLSFPPLIPFLLLFNNDLNVDLLQTGFADGSGVARFDAGSETDGIDPDEVNT
jgi:hypothetical protein